MRRSPIATPAAPVQVAWCAQEGAFALHPAGLAEGIRPEWDAARARLEAQRRKAAPIVQELRKPPVLRRLAGSLAAMRAALERR